MNDNDFKEWEKQVTEAEKHNSIVLMEFEKYLKTKKLKPKTINNHVDNIDFFANGFLLRYDVIPIEKGFAKIGSYLGDYFIRKTSWSSKNSIKQNIVSFKKFYTFLYEIGKIPKEDLEELKDTIKEEKEYWIEAVESYWDDLNDDFFF